jgi:predicted transcriptional regulator
VERGRVRGHELTRAAIAELLNARLTAGISQRAIARLLGWSQSRYSETASTTAGT